MKRVLACLLTGVLVMGLMTGCAEKKETAPAAEEVVEEAVEEEEEEVEEEIEEEADEEPEIEIIDIEPEEEPETDGDICEVRVAAMKGPTAMGLVQLMDQAENGPVDNNNYTFQLAGAPDEVVPLIAQGELDIAAVPANLASVLYNNTEGKVQVLAINTLGVLYIVQHGDAVASVEDLKGRTIYSAGKGSTPEYALNYILRENGVDPEADVTIEWKAEHAECVAALEADEEAVAMLPQPFATTAQLKDENMTVALDLTAEWDKLQEGAENASAMITGVAVVRKAFAEENPEAVNRFLDAYAASVQLAQEDVPAAAALIGKYEIVPEPVAMKALPFCNITMIEGAELEEKLSGYLQVLFEQEPKAVGGKLPEADFYYSR